MLAMMDSITEAFSAFNSYLWGPVMVAFLFGSGLLLTVGMKFFPIRNILFGAKEAWKSRKINPGPHAITPWQSLMTAMSATVGTGNIVGVATAIMLGGPGALFWMWMTGFFGIATKFSEIALAIHYKEKDANGDNVGGPMYYIKRGIGSKFGMLAAVLAGAFCVFTIFTGLVAGNGIQSNSVVDATRVLVNHLGVDGFSLGSFDPKMSLEILIAGIVTIAVGIVTIGGFKRIAQVADKVVPTMAVLYFAIAIVVLVLNADKIPGVFALIFKEAFNLEAAGGGAVGSVLMLAMRYGASRGVLSNEAGIGSAPIAHGASTATDPVLQGSIGMLGTVVDTLIICTLTGLVILVSGVYSDTSLQGVAVTTTALNTLYGTDVGTYFIPVSLALFAYTSILGWAFYSEVALKYLLGVKAVLPFRILFLVATFFGGWSKIGLVWTLADTANGLMIIPNMIGVLFLVPVLFKLVKDWKRPTGYTGLK